MNPWGKFKNEEEFNNWLKGPGNSALIKELDILFGTEFKNYQKKKNLFGEPDTLFYSEKKGLLLYVESATILNKRHLAKDILYSLCTYKDLKITSKIFLWIVATKPSRRIIRIVGQLFSKMIVDGYRLQFHISSIVSQSDSKIRINIENSFGNRIVQVNDKNVDVDCLGAEKLLSIKAFSIGLGIPYSTVQNVLRRWDIEPIGNKIPLKAIPQMIQHIEQKASTDHGINFSGCFIPAHQKDDNFLLGAEVNQILGLKGHCVRVKIPPRKITILGSSPRGYRLLFDREDVIKFKTK